MAEYNALHILHVCGIVGLLGTVFYACAAAPETRRRTLMWSGIASVLVLISGIRMWQSLYGFHGGWAYVKIVCWLGLSGLVGVAYRRREKTGLWLRLAFWLAVTAIAMVYLKPF